MLLFYSLYELTFLKGSQHGEMLMLIDVGMRHLSVMKATV